MHKKYNVTGFMSFNSGTELWVTSTFSHYTLENLQETGHIPKSVGNPPMCTS